jgi:hypothetical protein
VEAFATSLETALAPVRQDLAALHATWEDVGAKLTSLQQSVSRSSAVPTLPAAASVDTAPPREISSSEAASSGCLVPDCGAPVLAKQLCETHYRIMRRTTAAGKAFDPTSQRPARVRAASKSCEEEKCTEPHYAKGLCRRHYMAARSRIRAAARKGDPEIEEPETVSTAIEDPEMEEPIATTSTTSTGGNGGSDVGMNMPIFAEAQPSSRHEALPTAEVVSRVVAQYRGGLDRVAEVLGRNKRTLIELLDRLDLMAYVTRVREQERQRIESATLRERLDDLLFREKLLEDLGCLKDVDDRARFEVRMRCAETAKACETIEEVLERLGSDLGLDEAGMKRLVWRYDLRRYLRGLKLKSSTPPIRTRV